MGDTNELMEFLSASLGATLDEIYQRLIDCDFTREDPGLAMFVVALLNALQREGRGNRPTEVVLMLAFGESREVETDVIFLSAPKLDWGQSIGMMISLRRVVSMELQVIVVAGSNDHLQSRGLLSRLTDGSIPSDEVIGEAIMTLLSAMAEVETVAKQRFTHKCSEGVLCVVTRVRCIARTPSVCVHDGQDDSGGAVQRNNSCPKQNGRP